MAEVLNCKYLLGLCYSCQKCLYCFTFSRRNRPCKCEKDIQPLRVKNPKPGQQIYQRLYAPDPSFPRSNEYLFEANTRFGYDSNFEEPFSYTFCGTCNSKIQRLREADKKAQQAQIEGNDNEVDALSDSSSEKEVDDGAKNNREEKDQSYQMVDLFDSDTDKEDEGDDTEDEEDNDLEKIKVQIIVKSKDIKVPTAKTLIIEPVNYKNVMETIKLSVQKTLRKKIKSKDYVISYKAANAHGPSNELEDELDFQEFLNEYKRIIVAKKRMSVIVVIHDIMKEKSGKKHVKVKYFFCVMKYNKHSSNILNF